MQPQATGDKYSKAIKKLYKLFHEHEGDTQSLYTPEDVDYHSGQTSGIKMCIDYLHQCRIAEKTT